MGLDEDMPSWNPKVDLGAKLASTVPEELKLEQKILFEMEETTNLVPHEVFFPIRKKHSLGSKDWEAQSNKKMMEGIELHERNNEHKDIDENFSEDTSPEFHNETKAEIPPVTTTLDASDQSPEQSSSNAEGEDLPVPKFISRQQSSASSEECNSDIEIKNDLPTSREEMSSYNSYIPIQMDSNMVNAAQNDAVKFVLHPEPQILWQIGDINAQLTPQRLPYSGFVPHNSDNCDRSDTINLVLQPTVFQNTPNDTSAGQVGFLTPYGWSGKRLSQLNIGNNIRVGVQVDVNIKLLNMGNN